MTKKSEAKTEENKPTEESKPAKKETREITLSTFKDIHNIDNMEYASLKAFLKAKDADKFKESKLLNDLDKLRKKNAFR